MERTEIARVYGIVQGVGFRPTVARLASEYRISGSVCNKGPYVEIIAGGEEQDIDAFFEALLRHPPERAVILKLDREELQGRDPSGGESVQDGTGRDGARLNGNGPDGTGEETAGPDGTERDADRKKEKERYAAMQAPGSAFRIIESAKVQGEIFVSPDIATCSKCKAELFDPANRRYLHPFINCTSCGPRATILDGMPYDRVRTSMAEFPMCPECEYEYTHAETRRYDAQPVCCNDCGPEVYLIPTDAAAKLPADPASLPKHLRGGPAITEVRRIISSGGIAAVKGIGGFHLCCDATDQEAVQRLRALKPRPAKPLAVMMKDLDTVHRECIIEEWQEEIIDGHQKPIILLPKKNAGHADAAESSLQQRSCKSAEGKLAPGVAPDNPRVGVMLPYAPVQMLLFDYPDGIVMPDCLVMTSGNVSGAAICRDDEDAVRELSRMCDIILSHNRLIRLRADDSVMDFYRGKPYMIRRSRGYAPLPFILDTKPGSFASGGSLQEKEICISENSPDRKSAAGGINVLAAGGELKNTFCVAKNQLFYPSPYVGDTEDMRTVKALRESMKRMCELLEAPPDVIACDRHPGYNSSAAARQAASELGIPVIEVQHHYAHIASCLAENGRTDRVIGVSFDGTGYGDDGTVWGGEFLTADLDGYERAGHIKPFMQLGGDISAKEGWRIAVSMLYDVLKSSLQSGIEEDELINSRERVAQSDGSSKNGTRAARTDGGGADERKTAQRLAASIVRRLGLCSDEELKFQFMMSDKNINAVRSTSAGRLFDAVSAVLGIRRASSFEGEASTTLQFAAERFAAEHGCPSAERFAASRGCRTAKQFEAKSGCPAAYSSPPAPESSACSYQAENNKVPGCIEEVEGSCHSGESAEHSLAGFSWIKDDEGMLVQQTDKLFMWLLCERVAALSDAGMPEELNQFHKYIQFSDHLYSQKQECAESRLPHPPEGHHAFQTGQKQFMSQSERRQHQPVKQNCENSQRQDYCCSADELAWIFHRALADGMIEMCCAIRERTGLTAAALSGGVFQNTLLLGMCEDGLREKGFDVILHSMVPPNDGGIALGQAAAAARRLAVAACPGE